MYGPFFGEFMGTLVLILLGDGAVANILLKKSKGENSRWMVIATAWGMAVVAGIFTAIAFGSPGAHINPAIALTVAVLSGDSSKVGLFRTAQIRGGFAGASLVWLVYLHHRKVTPDSEAKLAVFCTHPLSSAFPPTCSAKLLPPPASSLLASVSGAPAVSTTGLPIGLGPWLWGVLVWGLGLGLGGPTGYTINPARDFGPRVAHAMLYGEDCGFPCVHLCPLW